MAEKTHLLTIPVDDLTMARLIEIADLCHTDHRKVAGSMLRDLLEDDALEHAASGIICTGQVLN